MPKPLPGVYIDVLTDFGFKFLFGDQSHKVLLIAFLNEIFRGRKVISDIEYGTNEHSEVSAEHRGIIVDLYCKTANNEHFIVEMQRGNLEFFKDRSLYYVSRLLSRMEKKGKQNWNYELPEVYFIGIMDFRFDERHTTKYFHDIRLLDVDTYTEFYNKLGFIYIELPNFTKVYTDEDDPDSISEIDKWIYVLKHLSELKKLPKFLDKRIFKLLFDIAEVGKLNKEELMLYETSLDAKRVYEGAMSYAQKLAAARGFEEGVEKGMEEGMEKGIEKGIEKGKMEAVKNLIVKLGFSDEQAADIAEVSIDFVKKIRKEISQK